MGMITVPDVAGRGEADARTALLNSGFTIGTATTVSSNAAPNTVTATDPAAGTSVNQGSLVNILLSAGPAAIPVQPVVPVQQPLTGAVTTGQIAVPNVFGLTRVSAIATLKRLHLDAGEESEQASNSVPPGGVTNTDPSIGTLVDRDTKIALEFSSGHEKSWYQNVTIFLFALLGFALLYALYKFVDGSLINLSEIAKVEVARALITILIAVSTVGIAVILAISTIVLKGGDDGDKRFDHGKQILTVLVGVLGTVVGFYFASPDSKKTVDSTQGSAQGQTAISITTKTLPAGEVDKAYPETKLGVTGAISPLKWSVDPKLPDELRFDAGTGAISGIPKTKQAAKPYKFAVTDSAPNPASANVTLQLEIK